MILSYVPTQVDLILRGRFASDFNSAVEREILKLGVQQLQDIFTIVRTNLHAWLTKTGMLSRGK